MSKQEFLKDDARFFIAPVDIFEVPDLDWKEQMTYLVLRSFVSPREATAFPSYSTIARLGRMSRDSAIRAVRGLVEKGLLHKEIRLDVSRNRKIKNTSNLYTINSPSSRKQLGVVAESNPPSSREQLGVVAESNPPSSREQLEQNNLTIQTEQELINNNKEYPSSKAETVVVDSTSTLETILQKHKIKVNEQTLQKWRSLDSEENIIKVIEEAAERSNVRNMVGYITRVLQGGYVPPKTSSSAKSEKGRMPEYILRQNQDWTVSGELSLEQKREAEKLLRALGEKKL